MLFMHRDISIDVDEKCVSKEQAIAMLDPILDLATDVAIAEIVVETNDYGQIMIDGGSPEEYAPGTLEFCKKIEHLVDVSLADEDYGGLDVINIYWEEDNMHDKELYQTLDTLLRETENVQCIDYTNYEERPDFTEGDPSHSIDLYDIGSVKNENEYAFFKEVRVLNEKLRESYKTELHEHYGDCEMGATAHIKIWRR